MATSASAFAAQLVADLDADRPSCTAVLASNDESVCGDQAARVRATCPRGHQISTDLCPRHIRSRHMYCPGRHEGTICDARLVSITAEVA